MGFLPALLSPVPFPSLLTSLPLRLSAAGVSHAADAFSSHGWDALAVFPSSSSSVPSPKTQSKAHLSPSPSQLVLVLLLPPRASVPRLWAMRAGAAASPGCFLPPPAGAQHLPACEPLSPDRWQLIPLLSGRCTWLSLRPPPAFIFPLSTLGGKKASLFLAGLVGSGHLPKKNHLQGEEVQ